MSTEDRHPLTTTTWAGRVVPDNADTALIREKILVQGEEDWTATVRAGDWDGRFPPLSGSPQVRCGNWMFRSTEGCY